MKYIPLDEWLASTRTRIVRALRWFDWVDNEDLCIAIGVADDDRARDTHNQALCRLVKAGVIARRHEPGQLARYRLVNRAAVLPPPNCEVESWV